MERDEVLRAHRVFELSTFRDALDILLAGPGRYFDPGITPDPSNAKGYCERYDALREYLTRDFPDLDERLPTRRFAVAEGEGLPVDGCLLRTDMEAMRSDVEDSLAALHALKK